MTTLDVDAVQAFVLVADLQSFTRAADALGTSQAAVSVKLKRLEERLGHKLIERTPRSVRLSARGAAFLDSARDFIAAHERAVADLSSRPQTLTLGISDHVAGPELPLLLARLHAYDPALLITVEIGASRALLDAFDGGTLDAAIVRCEDDRRDGEVLGRERVGWFAAPSFVRRDGEALRLAGAVLRRAQHRRPRTRRRGDRVDGRLHGRRHDRYHRRGVGRPCGRRTGAAGRARRQCRGRRASWPAGPAAVDHRAACTPDRCALARRAAHAGRGVSGASLTGIPENVPRSRQTPATLPPPGPERQSLLVV